MVNCPKDATHLLMLLAIGWIPAAASAGDLAATSRGTVSISITVPPHARLTPIASGQGSPQAGTGALCLTANGIPQFHVAVVPEGPPSSSAVPLNGSSASVNGAGNLFCSADGNQGRIVAAGAAGDRRSSSSRPVTVLIVAD